MSHRRPIPYAVYPHWGLNLRNDVIINFTDFSSDNNWTVPATYRYRYDDYIANFGAYTWWDVRSTVMYIPTMGYVMTGNAPVPAYIHDIDFYGDSMFLNLPGNYAVSGTEEETYQLMDEGTPLPALGLGGVVTETPWEDVPDMMRQ